MYIHLLPQLWIDQKLHVKWKYLLCFIVADTVFLLGGAHILPRLYETYYR